MWNGDEPIADLFEDKDWVNQIEASVGQWVANYFQTIPNPSTYLSWKSVGEWHQVNHSRLLDVLQSKKVLLLDEEDNLIWSASKLGEYRVNLGYEL